MTNLQFSMIKLKKKTIKNLIWATKQSHEEKKGRDKEH